MFKNEFIPNILLQEEKEQNDPLQFADVLNAFFTSLSSLSLSSDFDDFIDKTFSRLKRENMIRFKTESFQFVHTNASIVEKLIINLNLTSWAGLSEIPSKLIKYCCSVFASILTEFFNHYIDLGKFPKEWKSAIVTLQK